MLLALQDVILPAVKIGFDTTDIDNIKLTIKESSPDSKVNELHIHRLPEQSFAFTLDHQPKKNNRWFKQLSCYVDPANDKGINKGCDLVIVTQKNSQWHILILDIKSDKPNLSETEIQLRNSELYIRYIMSMIESYYGIDIKNIRYQRTIVTTGKRVRKGPTYKVNDYRYDHLSFRIVPIQPKIATIYLSQLLL